MCPRAGMSPSRCFPALMCHRKKDRRVPRVRVWLGLRLGYLSVPENLVRKHQSVWEHFGVGAYRYIAELKWHNARWTTYRDIEDTVISDLAVRAQNWRSNYLSLSKCANIEMRQCSVQPVEEIKRKGNNKDFPALMCPDVSLYRWVPALMCPDVSPYSCPTSCSTCVSPSCPITWSTYRGCFLSIQANFWLPFPLLQFLLYLHHVSASCLTKANDRKNNNK